MNLIFNPETNDEVKRIIEKCYTSKNHPRIRVFYGDVKTGKDWGEEYDTMGYIGASMGPQQIPLLINSRRSMGGGGILTHCIVKITSDHVTLYQHPLYHTGVYTWKTSTNGGYCEGVFRDGQLCAQFTQPGQAVRYIAFMKGERNSK